ncbi:Putrescine importer PuuP, partial [Burkholderia pyrrocinia]
MNNDRPGRSASVASANDSEPHAHRCDATGRRNAHPLGLFTLVIFGLAYMLPMTVFTTYGIVTSE